MKSKRKKIVIAFVLLMFSLAVMQSGLAFSDEGYPNTHENTGDQATDIVSIAKTQLGYAEPPSGYSKFGLWYETTYKEPELRNGEWCTMFLSWCARQAGIPTNVIPSFTWCPTGVSIFKSWGVWHEPSGYTPQPGDIIFFTWGHVGIVTDCSNGFVNTIEGNKHDGTFKNEAVRSMSHPSNYSDILGYASPRYERGIAQITVDKERLKLYQNESSKINVSLIPENAPNKDVTWRSDNPEIATVDPSGNVVGKSPGDTWINVIANAGGKTARTLVSVYEKLVVIPEEVEITASVNPEDGTQFIISTQGLSKAVGIGSVRIPTWSSASGQDDLLWYDAVKNAEGEYSVTVDLKNHQFVSGQYNSHAYLYGFLDENLKTYVKTWDFLETEMKIENSMTEAAYKVRVSGASNPEGVKNIRFPTWTIANGQDDLNWIQGTYLGNDIWEATVNFKDYPGTYHHFVTNIYLTTKTDQLKYIGAVEKNIENPLDDLKIEITEEPTDPTKHKISTHGLAGKVGVSKLMFPLWSEQGGQDDLIWYEGIKDTNGEYSVSIDIKNHQFLTGNYVIHAYVYGLNEEVLKTYQLGYLQGGASKEIITGDLMGNYYKLTIKGIRSLEGVSNVLFPTWTVANGQTDLNWIQGTYLGNDTWEAMINLNDYTQNDGTFMTHIYLSNGKGELKKVGECLKNTKEPKVQEATNSDILLENEVLEPQEDEILMPEEIPVIEEESSEKIPVIEEESSEEEIPVIEEESGEEIKENEKI